MEPTESAAGAGWQSGVDALRAGRVSDAIALLQSFVDDNPDSFEGNNFLGVALAQAKRPDAAITFLQRATHLNPGSAQAHYNLGLALMGNNQLEAARGEFSRALELDPNHAQAQSAIHRLPALQPDIPAPVGAAAETPATGSPVNEVTADEIPPSIAPSRIAPPGVPSSQLSDSTFSPAGGYNPPAAIGAAPLTKLTFTDVLKAWIFGSVAALIGAFIWDKIVYYTNYQIGLVAVGVGILVGIAVSTGASGKPGTILKVMGAVLAGLGILLGQALIIMDQVRAEPSMRLEHLADNPILLFIVSVIAVPASLVHDPLSLIFVAFGVWEGWRFSGASHSSQSPAPVPATGPPANPAGVVVNPVTPPYSPPPVSGFPDAPSAVSVTDTHVGEGESQVTEGSLTLDSNEPSPTTPRVENENPIR